MLSVLRSGFLKSNKQGRMKMATRTRDSARRTGTERPDPLPESVSITTSKTKQFNFARHWKNKIVRYLDDPGVAKALTLGLKLYDIGYKEGDAPWLCGRGQWNGQRVREGCLSWYQPWGRCHHIAPFCWALGMKVFPHLKWGFVSGELHTVVIGWSNDPEHPEWVMDILLFREKSAQESLDFARQRKWEFHGSLARYVASFFSDPETVYAGFAETIGRWENCVAASCGI
jgi:hypothetical protein